jgi:hypothetical protein
MQRSIPSAVAEPIRIAEARYSYYRRCQVFRKGGEQCKAPAEKGSHICYAHAAQQAMAFRHDLERRIVLAEAVAEMRRQGHGKCELANLLTDFKGIQVTLAVMARAIIGGRIDCKTAGRLVVHLQTMSKLLRLYHRGHRGSQREKNLTTKDTKEHQGSKILPRMNAHWKESPRALEANAGDPGANEREKIRIVLVSPLFSAERTLAAIGRVDEDKGGQIRWEDGAYRDSGQAHGPPKLRAA